MTNAVKLKFAITIISFNIPDILQGIIHWGFSDLFQFVVHIGIRKSKENFELQKILSPFLAGSFFDPKKKRKKNKRKE